MNQKIENLIVVLDAGAASTRMVAAEVVDGALRYRGHGIVESAGMRKGLIGELAPAAKAFRAAMDAAERSTNSNIDSCVIGIGGPHIRGLNTCDGINLGARLREITRDDVRNAVDRARAIERPADREILHLLPRQFLLDGQPGIYDPIGMVGAQLMVDLHIATCSTSALQSIVTCANKAGIEVTEGVLESLAAAEATLTADERELGVCLLDVGAQSTEVVVFFEGAVVHTASIPIGGQHFTTDLATGLSLGSITQAEELKKLYGNAVVTAIPQHAEIEILNPHPQTIRLRSVAEILEPRACELFYYIKESLRQGGVLEALGAGCVLTGGGSLLPGMLDVAESQLRVHARGGLPVRLPGLPPELVQPGLSVAVGMLLYTLRSRTTREAEDDSLRSKIRKFFGPTI